jgi:hypothetical protein
MDVLESCEKEWAKQERSGVRLGHSQGSGTDSCDPLKNAVEPDITKRVPRASALGTKPELPFVANTGRDPAGIRTFVQLADEAHIAEQDHASMTCARE